VEDARFITGRGRYVGDIDLPGMAHGQVLLSPHAHARIKDTDVSRARGSRVLMCSQKGARVHGTPVDFFVHERVSQRAQPTSGPQEFEALASKVGDPAMRARRRASLTIAFAAA
jgi:CO/xanthine dehydrogenase Mo-binding subunit